MHVDINGIETIPTVVAEPDHPESTNVRINTPVQCRAKETPSAAPTDAAAKPASERAARFAPEPQSGATPNPKPAFASKPAAVKRSASPDMQPVKRTRKQPPPSAEAVAAMQGVDLKVLGYEILHKFEAARQMHKRNVYDANNSPIVTADTPLYRIVTKKRKGGESVGGEDTQVDIYAPLTDAITGKSPLRSVPNIERAFGIKKPK